MVYYKNNLLILHQDKEKSMRNVLLALGLSLAIMPCISVSQPFYHRAFHHHGNTHFMVVNGMPSGNFSVYLLALEWLPEYCRTAKNYDCAKLRGSYTATHLGIHGLWPEYYRASPTSFQYCINSPGGYYFKRKAISQETWNEYVVLAPVGSMRLAAHEWKKHGTCSGLTQEQYFKKTVNEAMQSSTHSTSLEDYIGRSLSYQQLAGIFGGKNEVALDCHYNSHDKRYYLVEIITTWSKETGNQMRILGVHSSCPKNRPIYIRSISSD